MAHEWGNTTHNTLQNVYLSLSLSLAFLGLFLVFYINLSLYHRHV